MEYTNNCYTKFLILGLLLVLLPGGISVKSNFADNTEMGKKICIIPIGSIDNAIISHTKKELGERINAKVDIGARLEYPDYAYSKKRSQYYSKRILKKIDNLGLLEYDMVLGIVDVDLYVPKRTFVFGEADVKKKVAVISLVRLRQEFYGLTKNLILFKRRAITEAVHELGHIYGLLHCTQDNCVMFFSNTLNDTDRKGSVFCDACKKAIKVHRGE